MNERQFSYEIFFEETSIFEYKDENDDVNRFSSNIIKVVKDVSVRLILFHFVTNRN